MKLAKSRKTRGTRRQLALSQATQERRQHDVLQRTTTDQAAKGVTVERVATQRAIDRLCLDGRINQRQYEAAIRLLVVWRRARLMSGSPNILAISAVRGGGGDPEGLRQAEARQAYDAALMELTESQRHAVELVVIWDHAPRNRIGTLERGLEALARHYKL